MVDDGKDFFMNGVLPACTAFRLTNHPGDWKLATAL